MKNAMVRCLATVGLVATLTLSGYCQGREDSVGSPYNGLVSNNQQSVNYGWVPRAERISKEHSRIKRDAPKGYLPAIGSREHRLRQSLRRSYRGTFRQVNPYEILVAGVQDQKGTCKSNDCKFPERIHKQGNCNGNFCVMISASWCGPCKQMYPMIRELRSEGYIFYVFDISDKEFKDYDAKFNVESVPTFIVFDKGKEVARTVGVTDKDWFKKKLRTRRQQQVDTSPYDEI